MKLNRTCWAALLLLAGCSSVKPAKPEPELVFQGQPAKTRINWDLAGIWNVTRFGTEEKPAKGDRWEAKWVLVHPEVGRGGWRDSNGQGQFWLSTIEVGKTGRVADLLVWRKPDGGKMFFSVNEQSFGFLIMTGDDGDGYLAVRTD